MDSPDPISYALGSIEAQIKQLMIEGQERSNSMKREFREMRTENNTRHRENVTAIGQLKHTSDQTCLRVAHVEEVTRGISGPIRDFEEARKRSKWLAGIGVAALMALMEVAHYSSDIFESLKWVFVKWGK